MSDTPRLTAPQKAALVARLQGTVEMNLNVRRSLHRLGLIDWYQNELTARGRAIAANLPR